MRTIAKLIAAFVGFSIAFFALATSSFATGTTTPPPAPAPQSSCNNVDYTQGSGTCTKSASAHVSDTATSGSASLAVLKGKVAVRDVNRYMTKTEKKHPKCYWDKNGGYNSFVNTSGHLVFFPWPYATKVCKSSHSSTGWVKVDSKDHTGYKKRCFNDFKPSGKPRVIISRTKLQYFGSSFANGVFNASAAGNAKAVSDSIVMAWCNCIGSGAVGSASAHGEASSASSAKVAIRGYAKAVAWVKAQKAKILTSVSLKATGYAKANATAKASTDAWVKVYCTDTPTQPTPTPENPTVNVNTKNDVDTSNNATVCANYDVPGSDTATLTFTSRYGSFPSNLGGKTFQVSGSGQQCTEYMAPSEVPSGGKDTITVSLRDNNTGLSDNTPNNNSTDIVINKAYTPMVVAV